jgi:uncharacterized protein
MAGMDRTTGRWISGWPHTSQSLVDVIGTPLATRTLRRMYGADDDALQDKPQNKAIVTKAVMAVAVPVARWEPRVELRRVVIASASVTWLPRALFGDRTPAGQPQTARVA